MVRILTVSNLSKGVCQKVGFDVPQIMQNPVASAKKTNYKASLLIVDPRSLLCPGCSFVTIPWPVIPMVDQFLVISPVLHAAVVRVLTCGILWQNYHRVNIIVNMPLPLQIMGIRFLMKVSSNQVPIDLTFYLAIYEGNNTSSTNTAKDASLVKLYNRAAGMILDVTIDN